MEKTATEPVKWQLYEKVAFRFTFILFVLYILFNPNGVSFLLGPFAEIYIKPYHSLVTWASTHILGMKTPVTIFTGGSGDTTYDYLTVGFIAILSAVGCLIWSVSDSRRSNYNKLLYWLTVIARYYVAITMVTYGMVKVIKLQFPAPSLNRLLEPYGDSSPMGLAWTYMGFSTGFNYFTGFAELSCGILLLFRKTSTLGAVVGLVVAGNIMAINYCFDVPVKLLSTALVVMCLFMLIKDAARLINFFFLNKIAAPANLSPHRFAKRWKNITLITIKVLLIAYSLISSFYESLSYAARGGDKAPKPPLYGIYYVQSFAINQNQLPPLTTDTTRWSRLVINRKGYATVKTMNDSLKLYICKVDTGKHSISMFPDPDSSKKVVFTYSRPKPGILLLAGKLKDDSIHISMNKFDLKKLKLTNRGFHWINEAPYNR